MEHPVNRHISTLDINRDTPAEDIIKGTTQCTPKTTTVERAIERLRNEGDIDNIGRIVTRVILVKGWVTGRLATDASEDEMAAFVASEIEKHQYQPTTNDSKQSNETHLELHKGPINAA